MRIKRIGMLAAIESALFLSVVLTIFAPLPVMFAYRRGGVGPALAVTALATALIFLFTYLVDPVTSFQTLSLLTTSFSLGLLTMIGFILGYGLRAKWKLTKLLVFPVAQAFGLLTVVFVVYYFGLKSGVQSIQHDFETLAQAAKDQLIQTTSTLNGTHENMSDYLETITSASAADLGRILMASVPLYLFWAIAIVTWILVHTGIYTQLLREWKKLGPGNGTVSLQNPDKVPNAIKGWIILWKETFYWRLPDAFIFPWLGFGALGLIVQQPIAHDICMTIFKILGTFYCFQGFSFVRFLMEYYRIPGFLRVIVYLLILNIPGGNVGFFLLMAVGVLDFWADFRNKNLKLGEVK